MKNRIRRIFNWLHEKPLIPATVSLILLGGVLIGWGASSPVGSSPDDDFHLASIWCAESNPSEHCQPGNSSDSRIVPFDLPQSICFAFVPEQSAACQGPDFGHNNIQTVETKRGNFTSIYPPGFYFTMNKFVSGNIEKSVLLMRTVNVLIFLAAGIALLFSGYAKQQRRTLWSYLAVLTPLGLFLIPSTNPSSWEIIGISGFALGSIASFETTRGRRWSNLVIATFCATLAIFARGDSGFFVFIAAVAVLILNASLREKLWLPTGFIALLGTVSLFTSVISGQASVATVGLGLSDTTTSQEMHGVTLLISNALQLPNLWSGVFGTWGLGWLDTTMPITVPLLATGVFIAMLFASIRHIEIRRILASSLLLMTLISVPLFVLQKSHASVGALVQPRYLLPVLIVLFIVLYSGNQALDIFGVVQLICIWIALTVSQALALHTNIGRYTHGTSIKTANLNSNIEWWWDAPIQPMTIFIVTSALFSLAVFIAGTLLVNVAPSIDGSKPAARYP